VKQGVLGDLFVAETVPPERGWKAPPHASGSHSSYTGARSVVHTWAERQSVVLQLLSGGAKTRQELAGLTPYGINGICSVVAALIKAEEIEPTGDFDVQEFHGRTTRRERLRIKRSE